MSSVLVGDQHTLDQLPPPIEGPSVWYGRDMHDSDAWLQLLSDAEVQEIEQATQSVIDQGLAMVDVDRAAFPLPSLAPRLVQIEDEVLNGRGFALLRGLPVERWSTEFAATAYYGLGAHLGSARSQNAKGHLLGHVKDLGRDPNDPNARIYQTTARQTFHTDSCDIVALLCLKSAKSGGESMLVSAMTVYNELHRRAPELVAELFEANAIDRRGEVPQGMLPYYMHSPFTWHDGLITVHYQRQYIDSAQRFPDAPRLSEKRIAALDLMDEIANEPDIKLNMVFRPGDIQLVHNHTLMHDRLGFEDWPEPERKRHLLRLWLAPPNARPLPESLTPRFGRVTPGNRGGVITPGTVQLVAPLEAE